MMGDPGEPGELVKFNWWLKIKLIIYNAFFHYLSDYC